MGWTCNIYWEHTKCACLQVRFTHKRWLFRQSRFISENVRKQGVRPGRTVNCQLSYIHKEIGPVQFPEVQSPNLVKL
jgi:hypothetical protein